MIVLLLCNYVLMNDGITLAMVSCLNILFLVSASPLKKENQTDNEKCHEKQPTYQMYESDLHLEQRNASETDKELKQQQRNNSRRGRSNIYSGRKLSDIINIMVITVNRQNSIALDAYMKPVKASND